MAQRKTNKKSGEIDFEKEVGSEQRQCSPKEEHKRRFDHEKTRQPEAQPGTGVMSQMQVAPKSLREAQQNAEVAGEYAVRARVRERTAGG